MSSPDHLLAPAKGQQQTILDLGDALQVEGSLPVHQDTEFRLHSPSRLRLPGSSNQIIATRHRVAGELRGWRRMRYDQWRRIHSEAWFLPNEKQVKQPTSAKAAAALHRRDGPRNNAITKDGSDHGATCTGRWREPKLILPWIGSTAGRRRICIRFQPIASRRRAVYGTSSPPEDAPGWCPSGCQARPPSYERLSRSRFRADGARQHGGGIQAAKK